MKVEVELDEDLRMFDKFALRELTGQSLRSIEQHAAEGRLRWTHKIGRRKCADAQAVRDYLDTFRLS